MRAGSAWSPPWRAGGPGCHGTAGRSTLSRPPLHACPSVRGTAAGHVPRGVATPLLPSAEPGGSRGIATGHVVARILFFFSSLSLFPAPPTIPPSPPSRGPRVTHCACPDGWIHGCMDARMHGCTDGWMGGGHVPRTSGARPAPSPAAPAPPPGFRAPLWQRVTW